MTDFERTDHRRISSNAVKTDIRLTIFNKREEIRVSTVTSEILRPRGAPGENKSSFNGGIETRRMRLTVIVVINSESTNIVTATRKRNNIAVLLPRGKRKKTESLLLREAEVKGLRDDGSKAASEEAVGEPGGVEVVGEVSGAAAVYIVRNICEEKERKAVE